MVKQLMQLLAGGARWSYLFRALLIGLSFAALVWSGFAGLWFFILFVLALLFYFFLPPDKSLVRVSYWLVLIFGTEALFLINSYSLPSVFYVPIAAGVIFTLTVMYALILGISEFKFFDRFFVYGILNTTVLALIFAVLLSFTNPYSMGIIGFLLFFVLVTVFFEVFNFFGIKGRRVWLASSILALLGVEFSWFLSSMTLGVINSAVFATLFFALVRDILIYHFHGKLNLAFIFKQFTFLVLFAVIIFAASRWTP